MHTTHTTARARLDERLRALPPELTSRPPDGWIAAIRQALGMSVRDLGRRMGTSGQRASQLEHAEVAGAIQLSTLERAAEAMNCRFVYAFVPNEPLEEMVQRQARGKAAAIVASVSHHMLLEAQAVPYRVNEAHIDDLATEFVDKRGLWSDAPPTEASHA